MAIHLTDNEEIVWKSYQGKKYRRFFLIRDLLLGLLISGIVYYVLSNFTVFDSRMKVWMIVGVILLVTVIFAGINQLMLLMNLYIITTERVIIKRGWLNRKLTSIKLENIIDTKAEQSFTKRLIKTGTIYLFTANDSQNNDDKFIQNVPEISNIDDPFKKHAEIVEFLKKSS